MYTSSSSSIFFTHDHDITPVPAPFLFLTMVLIINKFHLLSIFCYSEKELSTTKNLWSDWLTPKLTAQIVFQFFKVKKLVRFWSGWICAAVECCWQGVQYMLAWAGRLDLISIADVLMRGVRMLKTVNCLKFGCRGNMDVCLFVLWLIHGLFKCAGLEDFGEEVFPLLLCVNHCRHSALI